MDRFYTSRSLADRLVASCKLKSPLHVADFASGDGALLKAAVRKWPKIDVTAVDLDKSALQRLLACLPASSCYRSDFLKLGTSGSARGCRLPANKKYDLVLLNPPFSCRGNVSVPTSIDGKDFRTSKAMAFVGRALCRLSAEGELLAIMPSSCLSSQKDRAFRQELCKSWNLEVVEKAKSREFDGCAVTIAVIRLTRRSEKLEEDVRSSLERPAKSCGVVTVIRGTMAVSSATRFPGPVPFVHSTELANGKVKRSGLTVALSSRVVSGPAVLLARVGRPRADKVAFKTSRQRVVLSDCVIALAADNFLSTRQLYVDIQEKWSDLELRYGGTCAPYITVDAVCEFLRHLGYEANRASSPFEAKKNVPLSKRMTYAGRSPLKNSSGFEDSEAFAKVRTKHRSLSELMSA